MKPYKEIQPTPTIFTDEQVVEKILNGEKELYEILLKRYNQTLYRVIRGYLNDNEVEDVMQETYIKAYEKLGQFQGDAAFSTWLIRIGINEALQSLRQKKKFKVVNLHADHAEAKKLHNMSDNMNPETRLINTEGKLLLEKSIGQLPEKYRIVYMLREVEGMKNPDISVCLNISEANVKVRLHRAKHLIRESLYDITSGANIFEFGNMRCDQMVKRVMALLL